MILLAMLADAIAPHFDPPDATYTYHIREVYADVRPTAIVTTKRLRFSRDGALIIAHLTPLASRIEASADRKDALSRLYDPLIGIEAHFRIDAFGNPRDPVDPEKPWAAFLASRAALRVKIASDPKLPPEIKAGAAKVLDAETLPSARDDRLRFPFAQLLPPGLPKLTVGQTDPFNAKVSAPQGALPASGSVTLVAVEGNQLRYHILLTAEPTSPQGPRFSEDDMLTIDRATGLLLTAHRDRRLLAADGHAQPIGTLEISREP